MQPYFNSYVQVVHNRSVTAAGHITQVFSFASTVSAIIVSLGIKYSARYKYFVVLGACVYITAIGLMILYRNAESSTGQLVGTQICLGIGGGMMAWPTQLGVQASASHQEVAAVTAIYLTLLEIGGAVGAAISGRVWTSNIPTKLEAYLPDSAKGEAQLIFGSLTKALEYPMGSPERIAINRAYEETIHKLLIIAICLAVPLIPLSLALSNYRLDEVRANPSAERQGGCVNDGGLTPKLFCSIDGSARSGHGRWQLAPSKHWLARFSAPKQRTGPVVGRLASLTLVGSPPRRRITALRVRSW